ncbi:MAG: MopE-related protein, partial [Pseudomonadota bacterium]|nr:MopE-related protein [Pseudomonadota bacterium]
DADCAGDDDFDQDLDGYPRDLECDDLDATRFPDPSVLELWYDGRDDNCDGNDGDQDGDGYYIADYAFELPSAYLPGDCYDDVADIGLWVPLNGLPVFGPEAAYPAAPDTAYDGLDQDCAGGDDFDQDLDGFQTDAYRDSGGSFGDDCDDTLATTNPAATESWYDGVDADCAGDDDFDQDHDAYASDTDCDDTSASISPGALEACGNTVDEDCSGSDNDAGAVGCTPFYADSDGDGFGADASTCLCEAEAPYLGTSAGDCDDADASVNPDGTESCATVADDDCDGTTNAVGAVGCTTWYRDADGDSYGAAANQCSCEEDGDYSATNDDDCNDASSTVHPGRSESCNNIDDDCDSSIDEGLTVYYADDDGDTYGDDAASGGCAVTTGAVTNNDDCDDSSERVYPGAEELCDGEANDCATASTWTSADEDQTVSFVSTDDVWSDASTTFAAISSASTAVYVESGTYNFCAGTYYTRLVASADTTDIVGVYGADVTTLQNGATTGSVVSVTNGHVLLSGFTVTGGKGGSGYGGGIIGSVTGTSPSAAPHLEIEDCIVTGNTAPRGGGVSSYGHGWIKLVRTTVESNTATTDGGGIHANTGADVTLEDSFVQDNTATGDGGGIFLDDGTLTITRTDIVGNITGDDGGGVFIDTGTATCSAGGVNSNEATDHGGGVYLSNQSSTTATFTSVSCDFGTGGTDNVSNDVTVKTSGYQDYASYGATASFVCSNASGLCTP